MPKFENAPNIDNSELNTVEAQVDVNADKKHKDEIASEELEKIRAEKGEGQEPKGQELSQEDQLKDLEGEMEIRQQEMTRVTESIEGTKSRMNEVREKLGLPQDGEDPPSIFLEKDKLKKLKAEQEALEEQKEELVSRQEKEELVHEEKEKILQEKLDGLFGEFEALNPRDMESIFKSGKTPEGRNVESKSIGSLDPEVAQSLARVFKEGIKLLPKILKALPNLLKEFDKDLTKEATKRVDERLEEEKQKIKDEQKEEKSEEPKPKEEPKIPIDEAPSIEVSPEIIPAEGGSAEMPKV